jgi:hypothetical protein
VGKCHYTFVENLDGDLVSLPNTTNDILLGDPEIVEIQCAGRTGTDSKLLFLLCNLDTHVLGCDKAGDPFVPDTWVYIGENQEDFGLVTVCDPPDRACKLVVRNDGSNCSRLTSWNR